MSAETLPRSLGGLVRCRRRELGMSQERLAARMNDLGQGVRQSDISRLERGGVDLPRRPRLEALACVLELPVGVLLERSGWNGAARAFDQVGGRDPSRQSPGSQRASGTSAT